MKLFHSYAVLGVLPILFLSFVTCQVTDQPHNDTEAFIVMVQMHNEICPRHELQSRATPGTSVTFDKQKCCSYCLEPESNCAHYGKCCLEFYDTFKSAHLSKENRRFQCVNNYLLVGENSRDVSDRYGFDKKRFWMWMSFQELYFECYRCLEPGADGTIIDLRPVTVFKVTYANKYCANCAGNFASMVFWDMIIFCDKRISLEGITTLSVIKEANCTVFFKPPKNVFVDECDMPDYHISLCNVTGLWPVFDYATDKACTSFIDPFNNTYQNYFCYLCNTDSPIPRDNWFCPATEDDYRYHVIPSFVALLDENAIKGPWKDKELDCASDTQFPDRNMMVCRNITCPYNLQLEGCQPYDGELKFQCHNVDIYMTLTPNQVDLQIGTTDEEAIVYKIHDEVNTALNAIIPQFQSYIKYVDNSNSIEYFAFHFWLRIEYFNWFKLYYLAKYQYRYTTVHVGNIDTPVGFTFNFVSPFEATSGKNTILHLEASSRVTEHILHPSLTIEAYDYVLGCQKAYFSRLLICPFVTVRTEEFSYTIQNGFLITKSKSKTHFLSEWEYEIHGNEIHICVEDFAVIFDTLLRSGSSKIESNDCFPGLPLCLILNILIASCVNI